MVLASRLKEVHNNAHSDLHACSQCGAHAVEHVRGMMGPGDYKEEQKIDHKGRFVPNPDFYLEVESGPEIEGDYRVSCSQCDNATPWNKSDAPNMPGVGVEFSRRLWNQRNVAKSGVKSDTKFDAKIDATVKSSAKMPQDIVHGDLTADQRSFDAKLTMGR
jgi:hypothetical protein